MGAWLVDRPHFGWRRSHCRRCADNLYPGLFTRHLLPLALFAGLGHLGTGSVDFMALAFLLLDSIPGITVGSHVTGVIPDWLLRLGLAIMLVYAGALLLRY